MTPKISFGIIVLNGDPFTAYNLRGLYPFAHEIIVVEGASPNAAVVATPDGHSRDRTLEVLREFKANEDPDDKVILVTAEDEGYDNGFWPGEKDEQSRAYARRATGDYLWQVDIDEFYREQDMQSVIDMLAETPDITAVSFKQITFWGGFDYLTDSWYLRRGATYYHRLFKWRHDYEYATHRPPTVVDEQGVDLRSRNWVSGEEMVQRGIVLYHYSLLLPKQVLEKCEYYKQAAFAKRPGAVKWVYDVYFDLRRPFRTHNVYQFPGWLERFKGEQPAVITQLRADLEAGLPGIELRRTDDVERLLGAWWYKAGRAFLRRADPIDVAMRKFMRRISGAARRRLGVLPGA